MALLSDEVPVAGSTPAANSSAFTGFSKRCASSTPASHRGTADTITTLQLVIELVDDVSGAVLFTKDRVCIAVAA